MSKRTYEQINSEVELLFSYVTQSYDDVLDQDDRRTIKKCKQMMLTLLSDAEIALQEKQMLDEMRENSRREREDEDDDVICLGESIRPQSDDECSHDSWPDSPIINHEVDESSHAWVDQYLPERDLSNIELPTRSELDQTINHFEAADKILYNMIRTDDVDTGDESDDESDDDESENNDSYKGEVLKSDEWEDQDPFF